MRKEPSMTKEIPFYSASKFSWQGNHGLSSYSKLGCMPRGFFCLSPKTGAIKEFEIDRECPGYEDHWDGEFVKLVDSERKYFITITAD